MNNRSMFPTLLDWTRLSRRGFFLASAAASSALTSWNGQASTPSCVLTSEQEEGPYYLNGVALRRDITEGKPGVPLLLRIALADAKDCSPLSNAAVDIWHCDALGVYSGFTANSPDGFGGGPGRRGGPGGMPPPPGGRNEMPPPRMPPPPGGRVPTNADKTRFLRGVQITNQEGIVEFSTLYPGWYAGRAIHIHLKAHLGGNRAADTYQGGHVSHTGQLFFPEDATERVAKALPYAKRLGVHRTTQEEDDIFRSQHGGASMVRLERAGNSSNPEGFTATVTLGIDPGLTPLPARRAGRRLR